MNWQFYLIIAVVAVFLIFQFNIFRQAKRTLGMPAPDTTAVDGDAHNMARRVYYFHATHCGQCRSMSPIVDRLKATHPNLIKINIDDSLDIALGFRIAATPSLVMVEDGIIKEFLPGSQSEKTLKRMLGVES
jgi:thiol-disulfide isomerase/thioredoxin